jgi:hypothetical protein
MMKNANRWLLGGTWAFLGMSVIGGMALLDRRLHPQPVPEPAQTHPYLRPPPTDPGQEARDRLARSLQVVRPTPRPGNDGIACLTPAITFYEKPAGEDPVTLLPTLTYRGRVEIDRGILTWTLSGPSMNAKGLRSTPEAIVIHRQSDGGEIERIAVLDPKAVAYEDLDVQPGRAYRYWVLVRGPEGVVKKQVPIPILEKEGEGLVEGRTPEWVKVHLMGGDSTRAILSVETYNPVKARWETSVVHAAVGQPIGRTGWTLERTRFDRFTLVAEAKDDRSEIRLLSTRKE